MLPEKNIKIEIHKIKDGEYSVTIAGLGVNPKCRIFAADVKDAKLKLRKYFFQKLENETIT